MYIITIEAFFYSPAAPIVTRLTAVTFNNDLNLSPVTQKAAEYLPINPAIAIIIPYYINNCVIVELCYFL